MSDSRRRRVPFDAIKAFREKIDAGEPPLGPAVVLTDPRITDALGVSAMHTMNVRGTETMTETH